MTGDDNRIRTTHAGSLPRPPHLRKLLAAAFAGQGGGEAAVALAEASATATSAAVQRQLDTGLDIVNNGEQGRESFFTYVQHRMSGFGGESERSVMRDPSTRLTCWRHRAPSARFATPGPSRCGPNARNSPRSWPSSARRPATPSCRRPPRASSPPP
jgi:hypothetical protein